MSAQTDPSNEELIKLAEEIRLAAYRRGWMAAIQYLNARVMAQLPDARPGAPNNSGEE